MDALESLADLARPPPLFCSQTGLRQLRSLRSLPKRKSFSPHWRSKRLIARASCRRGRWAPCTLGNTKTDKLRVLLELEVVLRVGELRATAAHLKWASFSSSI